MKGLITAFSFAIITSLAVSTADSLDAIPSTSHLFASQIYSAAFNDVSPGFDDLYVIKTQDKGREIVIYCNTTYCYKNRNSIMTS
jgi:NADH:ubiquinone oxidoreductase subunit E